MKSKVIVIGGAGFIGSHLVSLLLQNNYQVIVIDDLSTGSLYNLRNDLVNPDLSCYKLDVSTSPTKLASLIHGASHVFHLAAKTSVEESLKDPLAYFNSNLTSTMVVLEAMKRVNIKHLIFSSTSAIYGDPQTFPTHEYCEPNPISPYALSKLLAEQLCSHYSGISTVCLRYFNVYGDRPNLQGSYKPVMSVFLEKAKEGKPLPIVNAGSQSRDFINVEDVASANLAAMQIKTGHHIFNVGSGSELKVKEIADLISADQIDGGTRIEPARSLADIDKIQKELGWKPTKSFKDWISHRIEPQRI
jgi:UDP-glucose 4-epimerase